MFRRSLQASDLSKAVNIINNVSYMYVDYYLPETSATQYPFESRRLIACVQTPHPSDL